MVQPIAPRLQACTCLCTKQHEIKSRRRRNDAIKRHSKHEMYEAAAGIIQLAVLQPTLFLCVCVMKKDALFDAEQINCNIARL